MSKSTVNIELFQKEKKYKANFSFIQAKLDELVLDVDMLHFKEKNCFDRFKYDRRKLSYLLGRLSAKHALVKLTGVQLPNTIHIDSGSFEFPVVKCPDIHNIQISISHCDDIGISLAFEETHPMGVDIEKINIQKSDTFLSQISNREKILLGKIGLDNIAGYTMIWSIKESLSKVIKTGMMIDFRFLEINGIKLINNCFESTFTHFGQYKALSKTFDHYTIALCLPKRATIDLNRVWDTLQVKLNKQHFYTDSQVTISPNALNTL